MFVLLFLAGGAIGESVIEGSSSGALGPAAVLEGPDIVRDVLAWPRARFLLRGSLGEGDSRLPEIPDVSAAVERG